MTTPTVTKRIVYNPQDHDYACWIVFEDGHEECIGDKPTFHDAELECGNYILNFYQDNDTPEAAARLIMEELAQEGRHEQMAKDMGGVWREPRIDPEVSPSDYMDVTPAYTCDVCGETKPEESFDYQDSDAIVCRSCTPIDPPLCASCGQTTDGASVCADCHTEADLCEERRLIDPPPCDNCDDRGGYPECDPAQEALSDYLRAPEADKYTDAYAWSGPDGQISYHFIGNDPNVCPFDAPPTGIRVPCPACEQPGHYIQDCPEIKARLMAPTCKETGEGVNWSERAIGLPFQSWAV